MIRILVLLICICFTSMCFAGSDKLNWGATGHRTVGEIAEGYISKKTKNKINELLDGYGLAFVSTYADEIKSDYRYNHYKPWHYVNFPFNVRYEDFKKNTKGDLITGIETCIKIIKDEKALKENKAFHLKILVHLIGDLHQPLHVGRSEDKGGNGIKVSFFWKKSNLHRVWDSDMINSYQMSYTELATNQQVLNIDQIQEIQKGGPKDWMYESQKLAIKIYDSVEIGDKLSYPYMYEFFPYVRKQLQKGGIRLAKVLDDIFL